jgi:hypothetical protein
MLMFMLQWLDSRVWVSEVQLTSSSSSARGRLGDGGTVRKLVVATTAGADDAMPARREKAIYVHDERPKLRLVCVAAGVRQHCARGSK